MPSRVNIYCKKFVQQVTADELTSMLDNLDWHMAAEYEHLDDDDAVDEALSYFAITPGEESWLELNFRPPERRQFLIDLLSDDDATEWIQETLEELNENEETGYQLVRQHLLACRQVVQIETGYFDFVDVAPVFAYQTARCFAELGDGLIEDDEQRWWKPDGFYFAEVYSPPLPSTQESQ